MPIIPCWSCGAHGRDCYRDCDCAKCLDPISYAHWRGADPDEYAAWLRAQHV